MSNKKTGGFSLFELILALALGAAAVAVSAPFLVQYEKNRRFESAAQRVAFQIRQTKMLAATKGESHAVCVPLGEANRGNLWRFLTIKNSGGNCADTRGVIETEIPYRVFQKNGKTEIKKIIFHARGTSTNKSFCVEGARGVKRKKITISNFSRVTVASGATEKCE